MSTQQVKKLQAYHNLERRMMETRLRSAWESAINHQVLSSEECGALRQAIAEIREHDRMLNAYGRLIQALRACCNVDADGHTFDRARALLAELDGRD